MFSKSIISALLLATSAEAKVTESAHIIVGVICIQYEGKPIEDKSFYEALETSLKARNGGQLKYDGCSIGGYKYRATNTPSQTFDGIEMTSWTKYEIKSSTQEDL